MIDRLIRLVCGHRRGVLVAAAAAAVLAAGFGASGLNGLSSASPDFQDPASQYERANKAVERATGQVPYYGVTILLSGRHRVRGNPGAQRAIEYVGKALERQPGFQQRLDYASSQIPELISRDGRETVVLGAFDTPADSVAAASAVRAALGSPRRAVLSGMDARFGGADVTFQELDDRTTSDLERAELLAFPVLVLLSFWFFRGLVAALLPPLVGGLAVLVTLLVLRTVNEFSPISVFALNLVSGVGLGLGVDYSLFVLSRYREELAGGADANEAIARTLRTTGRTVLYSSLTVAVAMTTLLLFPIRFLSSMGIGGAVAALSSGAAALLVLPVLLLVLGPRVNALSPAWLQRRAAKTARPSEESGWWKLASGVMRRPGMVALLASGVMLLAALPALHLRLVDPGADLLPPSAESRVVEEALVDDFAANPVETIDIVVRGSFAKARRLAATAAAVGGSRVTEVEYLGAPMLSLGKHTWEISLLPRGNPYAGEQQDLIGALRTAAGPYGGLVGGWTAYFVDQKASIASHAPLALLLLMLLTGGAIFLMTGSLLLPLKAIAMNLLTLCTGAGLLVLVFQDGNLSGPLGFSSIGGLEEASMVLMFVVVFALSTDYELFVLGRIKEGHDAGLGNREAVALGMERTGRLITAAALLFCVAVGALATTSVFITKQFGFGAAMAVALDATIVRALLVPSFMALLGDLNWWAPRPLRRLHKRIGLSEAGAAPYRSLPNESRTS
jgi:RND superfamily putative drug exporter